MLDLLPALRCSCRHEVTASRRKHLTVLYIEHAIQFRRRHPAVYSRFCDVHYQALTRGPIGTVQRISTLRLGYGWPQSRVYA